MYVIVYREYENNARLRIFLVISSAGGAEEDVFRELYTGDFSCIGAFS